MYKIVILIILMLVSCSDAPKIGHEDFQRTEVDLKIHVFDSKYELQKVIGKKSGEARWSPNDSRCDVFFVKGDFKTAGHELHHCMYGSFHKE